MERPTPIKDAAVHRLAESITQLTLCLRDKQTHPLIASMMKPAESSDPPPATAAASGASSSGETRTTSHEQFQ